MVSEHLTDLFSNLWFLHKFPSHTHGSIKIVVGHHLSFVLLQESSSRIGNISDHVIHQFSLYVFVTLVVGLQEVPRECTQSLIPSIVAFAPMKQDIVRTGNIRQVPEEFGQIGMMMLVLIISDRIKIVAADAAASAVATAFFHKAFPIPLPMIIHPSFICILDQGQIFNGYPIGGKKVLALQMRTKMNLEPGPPLSGGELQSSSAKDVLFDVADAKVDTRELDWKTECHLCILHKTLATRLILELVDSIYYENDPLDLGGRVFHENM
mmetsp:Transcript_3179/g.7457  ORF Transcript_3179/g.7457 Transcript_3179/m.7457 type:complete len:267 (+) Transcript_3179:184-984(+)